MSNPVREPMTRNSVVLLADGSVARRNCDGPAPPWGGPWTHYPARPLPRLGTFDAVDPGDCVPWDALAYRGGGVDRVLYTARDPAATVT